MTNCTGSALAVAHISVVKSEGKAGELGDSRVFRRLRDGMNASHADWPLDAQVQALLNDVSSPLQGIVQFGRELVLAPQ